MSAEPVISVDGVSKAYPLYRRPGEMIKEMVFGGVRHDVFWALRDISFQVKEKQRLGIIGRNGAGKSTLLQIISGNLSPSSGTVIVNGKVSALLSLTPTWSLEDDGVENIRFNLLLQGCDTKRISDLTEEIIDFTELGPFMYQPVKTYSSGMSARLAFAIATAISPEILIVDEVLGAGDGYFASKAAQRMRKMCDEGKALLFVSHSTNAVQMLCDSAMWIENGGIRHIGPVDYVTKLYEQDVLKQYSETARSENVIRKKALIHKVHSSEIGTQEVVRIRVISASNNPHLNDTHFVRRLAVTAEELGTQEVSLSYPDISKEHTTTCLDFESQWGRLYQKNGNECRILANVSGKLLGGHVLIRRPAAISEPWGIKIEMEVSSIRNREPLKLEYADYGTGEWRGFDATRSRDLSDGFVSIEASCILPFYSGEQIEQSLARIEEASKPIVEILDVMVFVDSEPTTVVKARQPFEIRVRVKARQRVPVVDVSITIDRSDGVYAFWQSSGQAGFNFRDLEGELTICFVFEQNLFGHGEYFVSGLCANGYDPINNFPYTAEFDRKLHATKFAVLRELETLAFGQLNMQVPVRILP